MRSIWKGADLVRSGHHPGEAVLGHRAEVMSRPRRCTGRTAGGSSTGASRSVDGEEVPGTQHRQGRRAGGPERSSCSTDEDFADSCPLTTSRWIDVLEFTPAESDRPRFYFAKVLLPGARGGRAPSRYVLLKDALERSGQAGDCQGRAAAAGVPGDAARP